MANYLINHQKKKGILAQKEGELIHALKHDYSYEKLVRAAERVRAAWLNVFKAEFARLSAMPLNSYIPCQEAQAWEALPVDEILARYRVKLSNISNDEQVDVEEIDVDALLPVSKP
jgi:hypothetical protein